MKLELPPSTHALGLQRYPPAPVSDRWVTADELYRCDDYGYGAVVIAAPVTKPQYAPDSEPSYSDTAPSASAGARGGPASARPGV